MRLYLKNIGMIKEADVKLDGLTVIAGENDTGKSTVGKSLFALLKANLFVNNDKFHKKTLKDRLEWIFEKISKKGLLKQNSLIIFKKDKEIKEKDKEIKADFERNEFVSYKFSKKEFIEAIFIETPFIFNIYETLRGVNSANSILEFEIPYNYLWWDLFIKLSHKAKYFNNNEELIKKIENIINGNFKKIEEMGKDKWVFVRENEIEIENVAMGIKQFGILYALLYNGYINPDRILVIDEPEVHLHPKWQIEYAKILVELVKRDVKVLVTSHSPYMIEALKKYSDFFSLNNKTAFYLSEDNNIYQLENSNSLTLERIFYKLSEPFDNLDELEENEKNV